MRFWIVKFRSPFEQVKAAAAKKSDAAKQSTAPSEGPALQQALIQQSLDSLAEELFGLSDSDEAPDDCRSMAASDV